MKFSKPIKNADLYLSDGRFYDLSEENGVLTLQLKNSVIWDRYVLGVPTFLIFAALLLGLNWNIGKFYPDLRQSFAGQMLLQSLIIPIPPAVMFLWHICSKENWYLDKAQAKLRWNNREIADLSKIGSIRAWRRGAKCYLALHIPVKFQKGITLKIGRFGFCRSEHS